MYVFSVDKSGSLWYQTGIIKEASVDFPPTLFCCPPPGEME
jgi:hypothetical protein